MGTEELVYTLKTGRRLINLFKDNKSVYLIIFKYYFVRMTGYCHGRQATKFNSNFYTDYLNVKGKEKQLHLNIEVRDL